jgi:hypothetical protein
MDSNSMPGRQWVAVPRRTLLSKLLKGLFPDGTGLPFDIAHLLEKWLPPFEDPAHFWWSSEYYWGALIWFYFLSYESELFADMSLPGEGRTDTQCSSTTRTTLERACVAYLALWLLESIRIAMSAVCAYADVADSRCQHGALDALQISSSCTFLASRSHLESLAFHFGLDGYIDSGFRHGSVGVHCVHCDYCEWMRTRSAVKGPSKVMLTRHSGSTLVA